MDNGDVIYDQTINSTLSDSVDSVQYIEALAVTGAISGTLERPFIMKSVSNLSGSRALRRLYFDKVIQQNFLPVFMI